MQPSKLVWICALSVSACGFQRTAEVPRAQAARLGPEVVVENESGDRRTARVTRVQPIAPGRELPAHHPELRHAPLFSDPPAAEEVFAAWERDPTWTRAEVSLDVDEPAGGWAIAGGAALGLVAGGLAAYALTSCTPNATESCEDSDTLRLGALFFLVPVGGLVGGISGGVAHQLFGGGDYRVVGPP